MSAWKLAALGALCALGVGLQDRPGPWPVSTPFSDWQAGRGAAAGARELHERADTRGPHGPQQGLHPTPRNEPAAATGGRAAREVVANGAAAPGTTAGMAPDPGLREPATRPAGTQAAMTQAAGTQAAGTQATGTQVAMARGLMAPGFVSGGPASRPPVAAVADERACAEACFAAARRAKGRIAGAADRAAARAHAIERYLQVAADHPAQGALTAEALFRAAELQRAANQPDAALTTLARIAGITAPGPFACRALYEAGHIERRRGDLDRALAHFDAAAAEQAGTERRRDLATYWKARCLLEAERRDAAEVVLRALVVACEDPLDRLRAYDTLILLLADDGRLATGVGFFAEAKRSVHAESLQVTELGERVRNALEDMRALDALRTAIRTARDG